jgi:predicted Zn-dependent peptidase
VHGFHISLFLRAGSIYEGTSGITHFLEHAAIRNVDYVMKDGLYSLLDRHGIEFNASTFSEMVQFYVAGAAENFNIAASVITSVLSPIILPPSEIKTESDRIKAEIREGDDRTSLTTFTGNIVHEGTSLSRSITGTLGSVGKITGKLLEEYRRSVMTSENIFFYVTGSYTEENLKFLAEKIGEYTIPSGTMRENIAPVCHKFGQRDGKVHIKNADFTMLRFSFDMDMTKMTMAETDLIYDMLLGGYNSKFFIEMSEKRGLFYDISGASKIYKNIGTLAFSYEVRGGSVYDAVEMTLGILKDFRDNIPTEESMMKAGYVDNAYLLYDDPRELNFTFAYDNHIMNSGYKTVEERAKRYKSITPERIREVARELFRPENLTLTLKGNKKKIDTSRLEAIIAEKL